MFVQLKFAKWVTLGIIVANAIGCSSARHLAHQLQPPFLKRSTSFALSNPASNVGSIEPSFDNTAADPVKLVSHLPPALSSVDPSVSSLADVDVIAYETEITVDSSIMSADMSLEDFESLAYANNPTIRELAATTQKAAGFRTQVGLRANPVIGYQGTQIADEGTDQHTPYIQQEIVTGGKLTLNRRVLDEAVRAQLLELEAQKYRVATDIKVKFYEALAAQKRIELIEAFQTVANKGLDIAQLRKKALEGSQVDVLQAKVQKNEVDLALQQSEIGYAAAWRELVALAGSPALPPIRLRGELPTTAEPLDWSSVTSSVLVSSPEFSASQVRVSQARASLERQGVQAIPNVTVQVAGGVDNGTNSGLMNLQVGVPIPVFNKNQGNIAAARAEFCRAQMEVLRIENSIKARMAVVSKEYDSSLAAVSKYSVEILPSAQESLDLAELAYKAGETSFVQVLVARRTFFDSNLQYVAAQSQLAQAKSKVDGFVLTGGLDAIMDASGDDSLRGLTFSQQ